MYLVFEFDGDDISYKGHTTTLPAQDSESIDVAVYELTSKTDPNTVRLSQQFNIDLRKIKLNG